MSPAVVGPPPGAKLLGPLERHCRAGKPLRLVTTTYTNSTELRALETLTELGADIKVSYATDTTRLHAKAWMRAGQAREHVGDEARHRRDDRAQAGADRLQPLHGAAFRAPGGHPAVQVAADVAHPDRGRQVRGVRRVLVIAADQVGHPREMDVEVENHGRGLRAVVDHFEADVNVHNLSPVSGR